MESKYKVLNTKNEINLLFFLNSKISAGYLTQFNAKIHHSG